MLMLKILLVLLSDIALGQRGLQWFFNPFSDENYRTLNIDNHAQVFDKRLGISREAKHIKVTFDDDVKDIEVIKESFDEDDKVIEVTPKIIEDSVSRSERGRSLNERASEPQLPPFRFRPFDSLARNINFRSPSNVFCKNLWYLHFYTISFKSIRILVIDLFTVLALTGAQIAIHSVHLSIALLVKFCRYFIYLV